MSAGVQWIEVLGCRGLTENYTAVRGTVTGVL